MKDSEWKILSLEVDDASKAISDFFEGSLFNEYLIKKPIPQKTYISKKELKGILAKATNDLENNNKILTLYGSGRYHHYTYGLCALIADKRSDNYAYLHFDHHTDFYAGSEVNCGGFVQAILQDCNAKKAVLIGSIFYKPMDRSDKKKCYSINQITTHELNKILKKTPYDVYLSFDLDVMDRQEISTDYPQGTLTVKNLLELIDIVQNKKNVISADVLGQGSDEPYLKGQLLYAIIAAKLLGENTSEFVKLHEACKKTHLT